MDIMEDTMVIMDITVIMEVTTVELYPSVLEVLI
jgi:hypothetical protein